MRTKKSLIARLVGAALAAAGAPALAQAPAPLDVNLALGHAPQVENSRVFIAALLGEIAP